MNVRAGANAICPISPLRPSCVVGIFVVVQQINSLVTAPKIVGDSVGLHPLTVIFSMLFWSLVLGGFAGALLAVPLTAPVPVDEVLKTIESALVAFGARFVVAGDTAAQLARKVQHIDFMMVGLVIFIWTLVLTVAIGCVIVWLMKGPAYVADGLEVSHSDKDRKSVV